MARKGGSWIIENGELLPDDGQSGDRRKPASKSAVKPAPQEKRSTEQESGR